MGQGTRDEMLGRVVEAVASVAVAHPTRVAIDGPPAAGKTTLADELAVVLRTQGCDVIRATIDDFLFPRAQRYPRGEYSAEGCYFDTHDHEALNRVLLDPLGPGGDRRFQHAVYDPISDAVLSPPVATAPADAVLVFDGVFLMRPELINRWDLRIFVSTALDATVDRAVIREHRLSSRNDVERRWRERYIPSQQFYCYGPPDRSRRHHRAQRQAPPAGLGDPNTLNAASATTPDVHASKAWLPAATAIPAAHALGAADPDVLIKPGLPPAAPSWHGLSFSASGTSPS